MKFKTCYATSGKAWVIVTHRGRMIMWTISNSKRGAIKNYMGCSDESWTKAKKKDHVQVIPVDVEGDYYKYE